MPSVHSILAEEKALKIDQVVYYKNFATLTENVKQALSSLLSKLKTQGKTIAAYGAAAKGVTLMNYIGIGRESIDFVVDRNTHKQGLDRTRKPHSHRSPGETGSRQA